MISVSVDVNIYYETLTVDGFHGCFDLREIGAWVGVLISTGYAHVNALVGEDHLGFDHIFCREVELLNLGSIGDLSDISLVNTGCSNIDRMIRLGIKLSELSHALMSRCFTS